MFIPFNAFMTSNGPQKGCDRTCHSEEMDRSEMLQYDREGDDSMTLSTRFVACADSPYRALHIGRSSVIDPSSMHILAMLLIVSLLARSSFPLLSFRSKP